MREENEITQEVKELLESLERHGQNARRQKELSDLIESLAAGTSLRAEYRRLYPIWWIVGAAAACLLFWLLAKPAMEETPNMNEEILVEEIATKDTIQEKNETIEESVILEESVPEILFAERTTIQPARGRNPEGLTDRTEGNDVPDEIANVDLTNNVNYPTDTSDIESNPIPNVVEEPIAVQRTQRRVIRSLNLVCYECQKEPEYMTKTNFEDKTIWGQPQDPNMKNGSLAFELNLH